MYLNKSQQKKDYNKILSISVLNMIQKYLKIRNKVDKMKKNVVSIRVKKKSKKISLYVKSISRDI